MQLETIYGPPGTLLLAGGVGGERMGCVGLRSLGDGVGEIRRLFVRDEGRGLGVGRSLTEQLISAARSAGMSRLVLNTLPVMDDAIGLYESLGFTASEPYVDEPLEGTLYFSLELV